MRGLSFVWDLGVSFFMRAKFELRSHFFRLAKLRNFEKKYFGVWL